MDQGQHYASQSELEHALRAFNNALNVCLTVDNFPNVAHYKHLVLGELANTTRRFGRYEQAKDILETALADMIPSPRRVDFSGELSVVYRHMDRLEDAKRASKAQYETAKQIRHEAGMCRAIGTLGMTNYQLSQQSHDAGLLALAIEQLSERVQIARKIRDSADAK